MTDTSKVLDFVKALSSADRLKIVGVLAQEPATLTQITEALSLPTRDVFNHLEFLKFVEVLREKDGLYELNTDGLEKLARRQFEGKRPALTVGQEMAADRLKVLAKFLRPDGTIHLVPNSRLHPDWLRIVLEYVLAAFEPGVTYTEKEVNTIIRRFHEDTAGLRRDLVDAGMLRRERDGSKYWREEN
ncbi:MAG: DUF2087 domain-containing protein [Chloroflexota bacterium]